MPEFEGVSESLSLQEALEDAVRKAYTASQRRTHTDPLAGYVVKRITGHLRTLTVVIETVADEPAARPSTVADEPTARPSTVADEPAARPRPSRAEPGPVTTADPIQQLLDKQRRNEPLTANEQALLDLLRQAPD
jgi:hypothetical protein